MVNVDTDEIKIYDKCMVVDSWNYDNYDPGGTENTGLTVLMLMHLWIFYDGHLEYS